MTGLTDDELAEQIRASLQRHAADVVVSSPAFDLRTAQRDVRVSLGPTGPAGHPFRKVACAACAAALLVAALAVVATRRGAGSHRQTVTATQPPAQAAASLPGALAPTSGPDGLALWSVQWGPLGESREMSHRTISETDLNSQLFGHGDSRGPKVMVVVDADPGSAETGPLTVRGHLARTDGTDESQSLYWQEAGAKVTATFRGLSEADAIAFLATLHWKSSDPMDGFAEPTAGELRILGEAPTSPTTPTSATFQYAEAPDARVTHAGRRLAVETITGDPAVDTTLGFLWSRFQADRAPAADGSFTDFDTTNGFLIEWPDGRSIHVDAAGTDVSEAVMREVADSVEARTGAQLVAMRAEVDQRTRALPDLGHVALGNAVVELHGDAGAPSLCLVLDGAARCSTPDDDDPGRVDPPADPRVASFLVDGQWYLLAVSDDELSVTGQENANPTAVPIPPPVRVPSTTGMIGGRHVLLATPTAATQIAFLEHGDRGDGINRPPF